MAGGDGGRRRVLGVVPAAGVTLLLLPGACGQDRTPPAGGRPGAAATTRSAPTVDLAAKNLTATAYRPTADLVTPGPTTIGPPNHGGPIVDHVSFVDELRGARCTVDPIGAVRQPFLRGEGILLRVSGCGVARPAELQSFWYHTDDLGTDGLRAAEEDARGIGPAGQPTATTAARPPAPHFYRKERAFVLYLGDDPAMLALLTDLLGPQFAGRRSRAHARRQAAVGGRAARGHRRHSPFRDHHRLRHGLDPPGRPKAAEISPGRRCLEQASPSAHGTAAAHYGRAAHT